MAAGERGRTIAAPSRREGLKRLVEVGYVVSRPMSMQVAHYLITDKGRKALGAVHWLRWPRLSEQIFRVDKWSLCRG